MKLFSGLIVLVVFALASCGKDDTVPAFRLEIRVDGPNGDLLYTLSDTGLVMIEYNVPLVDNESTEITSTYAVKELDTLRLISRLDPKAYNCPEQHALDAMNVTFTNDSGTVNVDPNINHPTELDYAVRLINSLVPPEYKLEFIDMQPAIEPDGKLRL